MTVCLSAAAVQSCNPSSFLPHPLAHERRYLWLLMRPRSSWSDSAPFPPESSSPEALKGPDRSSRLIGSIFFCCCGGLSAKTWGVVIRVCVSHCYITKPEITRSQKSDLKYAIINCHHSLRTWISGWQLKTLFCTQLGTDKLFLQTCVLEVILFQNKSLGKLKGEKVTFFFFPDGSLLCTKIKCTQLTNGS